ncbi:Uncharacterised protein [Mycobacterium tuberculosis]|nr:Uncharacterised protein [Mycobacterium tuberculosis]
MATGATYTTVDTERAGGAVTAVARSPAARPTVTAIPAG